MALNVENISGGILPINDLGITLSIGQTVDLSAVESPDVIGLSANGGDLDSLITAVSLEVKDPFDGTTALSVAEGLIACRSMNDPHYNLSDTRVRIDVEDATISFNTLEEANRRIWSTGPLDTIGVTDGGSGTVDVTAGEAFFHTSASGTADIVTASYPASTGLALTDNVTQLVYANYNAGSPVVAVTTDLTLDGTGTVNFLDTVLLAFVERDGTVVTIFPANTTNNMADQIVQRLYDAEGLTKTQGAGTLIQDLGLNNIGVTAGSFYYGLLKISHAAFDTSASDTFTYWRRDGAGGWIEEAAAETDWDDQQFDTDPGLSTMINNRYNNVWIYLQIGNPTSSLHCIYGTSNIKDITGALTEDLPGIGSSLPPPLQNLGIYIGRFVFQRGATSAALVISAFQDSAGAGGGTQNLWESIASDSGSAVADSPTDTFTVAGGTGISTAISGDTLTITNTGSGGTDRDQTIYVGKHGSDANSGLRPELAKLTIAAAMTAASALTPTTSNRIAVVCEDGGTYAESFTVPSWVSMACPDVTVEGTITLSDDTEITLKEVVKTTSGSAITKPAGTDTAYVTADIIRAEDAANAVVNGAVTSVLIVHARQIFTEDGTGVLDNSTGIGHIHLDVEDLYITGTGTGVDRSTNTGSVQGRISHIVEIGGGVGVGTAIDITSGSVSLNVGTIDTTTAWNVTAAGTLKLFVNEIIQGARTQASGAAVVDVIESMILRWLPIDTTDSPYLTNRLGYLSVDTTAGAVTIELPTPASDGDNISFQDVAKNFETNNLTLDGNGATIDGLATQTLNVNGTSGIVIYSDALGEWSLKRIQEEVAFSPSNVIYVTKNGNDISGDGSFSNPYLTVAKGVLEANLIGTSVNPTTVKVLDGIYDEINPIVMDNEWVNVQGDQEFSCIIRPTVPASDMFELSSGTPTVTGPSITRATIEGTAAFKTAGSSLVTVTGDGRFVLDKVNLSTGGIGIESGLGTISTGQECVYDFATIFDCTTGIDVNSSAKQALQVVFLRNNDTGIIASNTSIVEMGNYSIQNANSGVNGTGILLEDSASLVANSGTIRNCVTGIEANDTSVAGIGSTFCAFNTNDFNQVDATAEVLFNGGSLTKDGLLIADGSNVSLNYIDNPSDDFIIGSADTTATPGLEFRVRQDDGRVFIGDNATNDNAATNTVGGSRTVNLVDTNGNFRVWRWDGSAGLHPAFEWIKGVNTLVADDEGDAPITNIDAGTDTITIDVSGTDYNDPLDPVTPGSNRVTLNTRIFFAGAEFRVNGTASNDGDYVVTSSVYNSGPETIDVVVTTDITVTEAAIGTAVFGGGAGRPDGVSTYIGDSTSALAAGVGDVHWDMLLRETDSFSIRRRTGGLGTAGGEHVRIGSDMTEFIHGPDYDGADNSIVLVIEGIAGTTPGTENYLQIRNHAGGAGGPEIEVIGLVDTDTDLELIPQGTGTVTVPSGYEANVVTDSLITKAYGDANYLGGSGDVTAAANMVDNSIIRGDGGVKGVQDSEAGTTTWTISDSGQLVGAGDVSGDYVFTLQNLNATSGNGFSVMAGEASGDIAFHIADTDDSFQIMEMEADEGYVTLGKTYAQTLSDNGVVHGMDNQHSGSTSTDFNTQEGVYRVAGTPVTVGEQVIQKFVFSACALDSPVNANWTVNALAPAAPDSNNAALTVRLFDDTTEEGVGFMLNVPTGATSMTIRFKSRAETAPGGASTVVLNLYNRDIPDNGAVTAWSAATALTALSMPTNENFQYDEQTITLATLGLTAGETSQFELTRDGTGTLTGDWALLQVEVEFV